MGPYCQGGHLDPYNVVLYFEKHGGKYKYKGNKEIRIIFKPNNKSVWCLEILPSGAVSVLISRRHLPPARGPRQAVPSGPVPVLSGSSSAPMRTHTRSGHGHVALCVRTAERWVGAEHLVLEGQRSRVYTAATQCAAYNRCTRQAHKPFLLKCK